jgi:hypothetical protein
MMIAASPLRITAVSRSGHVKKLYMTCRMAASAKMGADAQRSQSSRTFMGTGNSAGREARPKVKSSFHRVTSG